MSEPTDIFLGFDPGGQGRRGPGNFGWSICAGDATQFQQVCSGLGRYAGEALRKMLPKLPSNARVQASGIDAPLFWDRTGRLHRTVDKIIQEATGVRPLTVNELRGSDLAQGVLLAALLRQRFQTLPITEVYPRALCKSLKTLPSPLFVHCGESEHERDARIAAYAAWSMHWQSPGWWDLFPNEPAPFLPLDPPVSYWMPI